MAGRLGGGGAGAEEVEAEAEDSEEGHIRWRWLGGKGMISWRAGFGYVPIGIDSNPTQALKPLVGGAVRRWPRPQLQVAVVLADSISHRIRTNPSPSQATLELSLDLHLFERKHTTVIDQLTDALD